MLNNLVTIEDYSPSSARPEALEYDDSMSKQQTEEIFKRLQALESASGAPSGTLPPFTQEPWLKRNAYWVMPLACLLLGSGILAGVPGLFIDSRIHSALDPLQEKITLLQTDVAEIKGELKRIAARTAIDDAANSPPALLAANLPRLQEALKDFRNPERQLPDRSTSEIQAKLLKVDASAPGYWPFVFDLISYRSILITGLTSPSTAKASEMSNVTMRGTATGVKGGYVRLSGRIEGVRFADSWVEFDASKSLTLKDVHFDHCVLVFVGFDPRAPAPSIQKLGLEILAANMAKFTIGG